MYVDLTLKCHDQELNQKEPVEWTKTYVFKAIHCNVIFLRKYLETI